ncbi:MAG TPA: transglutaminase family protein, partial [Gammaproteobacteria bacterium]|nr:transglutaminase family protein [Gammaproteobacteria bacterium]
MAIRVALKHHTAYEYDRAVTLSPHVIRLRPAPHCRTPIRAYSLKVKPEQHFINWQQDPFGNYVARFVFPEKTRLFSIDVELIAEMTVINPFDFFLEESAEKYPFRYEEHLERDLTPYLEIREQGSALMNWLDKVDRSEAPCVDFLVALNQRLQKDIAYLIRLEHGVQTCEETLQKGSGSCRDSAWLLIQILRHLGLAARFVSGYLVQLTADVKALDGPSGPEKDFTDLHAWVEVFLPGAGWVGLDPTSGLFAGEGHIPLACTPDPSTAAPVSGAVSDAETRFDFSNKVTRIHEDPRVTRPYSDDQWDDILALGEKIDQQLVEHDVRLTMGGEPTFVSVDDMDGAEWNNVALGKKKRQLAGELLLRLQKHYGQQGLLHYGQGKWYPGEPLPRWALSVFWRKDGQPMWEEEQWLADDNNTGNHGNREAKDFITSLADNLGIDQERIVPGYEDTVHYLLQEDNLPVNVDPMDNKLKDPLERERLSRTLREGLEQVAGFALPLKWLEEEDRKNGNGLWKSSAWPFRADHMFLLPGDSAMGYRLPLASLPWKLPDTEDLEAEPDPFADRDALPDMKKKNKKKSKKKNKQDRLESKESREIIHTAVCVEAREGRLHIFMPPFTRLEGYLHLINSIEATATALKMPVVIEGYEPPWDPRISKLQITPDPGVIEVNIHPAYNWRELTENTQLLYEEARQVRLGTEKFMI